MNFSRSAVGAKTLPGEFFTSPDIYENETQAVFRKAWICVGRDADIPQPGDYLLHELDGESLIVVRDEAGVVNCLYNVCRHRGTRLCETRYGKFSKTIQCPYHAWTYGLDGRLRAAPNMKDVEYFDVKNFSLQATAATVWQGFIFVNLDRECESFETSCASFLARFDPWELTDLVSAHRVTYDLEANWKIVFQNYSECYHCSSVHPQLTPVTSVKTASNDFEEGPFLGGPMVLADDHETVSVGGQLCGQVFPQLSAADRQRVYFYTLFPSLFVSPHPDYVLTHRIERRGPDSTRIVCDWLFPPEVIEHPGFDVSIAVEFWDLTNRQDWHVCELTQSGVRSKSYEPGPYSNLESMLAAFDRHYLNVMREESGTQDSQ